MSDEGELEIIGTEKIREEEGSPAITLPREALDRSDLAAGEFAIVATNGRSVFLVPSTAESIDEAIDVDDGSTVE